MRGRAKFLNLTFSAFLFISVIFNPQPASALSTNPTPVCSAGTCTITFAYTGDYYVWTAPYSINYTLETWGAQGGNAGYNGVVSAYGGKGGYSVGSRNFNVGETLYIYVGGQGAGPAGTTLSTRVAGGFNGGGQGWNPDTSSYRAGGGGGATDFRYLGSALSNRILIAGGGSGGINDTTYSPIPGAGGGVGGSAGYATVAGNSTNQYSGKGGTSSAGGVRGSNCAATYAGTNGVLGIGGDSENHPTMAGSGGGGGYYGGGGGGCQMTGGGGSGFYGTLTSANSIDGATSMPNPSGGNMTGNTGNGTARITYSWATANISLAVSGGYMQVEKGKSYTVVATIDLAGKVTFFADGKKIAKCISMQASAGTVNCIWKPTQQKSVNLTAYISPSGGAPATSLQKTVSVVKRVNSR